MVDEAGAEVPQTELYVHHWLMYDLEAQSSGGTVLNDGLCSNLPNVWGIGAELRGTNYTYPAPYGIVVTGKETWGVNLHFIRTTNVVDIQPFVCLLKAWVKEKRWNSRREHFSCLAQNNRSREVGIAQQHVLCYTLLLQVY